MESVLKEPILGRFAKKVSISNSEIQTFKRCKRRWYLEYYRGLKKKVQDLYGPLTLGNRVHAALEAYYAHGTHPMDEYQRLQRIDHKKFLASDKAEYPDEVKKFEKECELGRIMIEGYMEWLEAENPDAEIKVIGAESKLSYTLNEFDPRVELIGKVDLKVTRLFDGSTAILDHKTAVTFDDYWSMANMAEQLMMYVMLEKLSPEGDAKVDGGIYNLLKKVKRSSTAKPPFYDRVNVRFNKKTLDSFWIRTLGTVRDIMSTRDSLDNGADHKYVAYPTQKLDWTCKSCPFFQVCTMFDDGSAAEMMISDLYEQIDPNARYEEDLLKEDGK